MQTFNDKLSMFATEQLLRMSLVSVHVSAPLVKYHCLKTLETAGNGMEIIIALAKIIMLIAVYQNI